MEMLEHVGYDLAQQPIRFISPSHVWVDNLEFFDPILNELFARDFVFSETRQAEIDRTLTELLVNARSACHEFRELLMRVEDLMLNLLLRNDARNCICMIVRKLLLMDTVADRRLVRVELEYILC